MTPTAPAFPSLFQPLRVGRVTLRNRVVIPGHQPRLARDHLPGDAYVAYYRARARGGAAMQCTGQQGVLASTLGEVGGVRIANVDDHVIPAFRRLADAVHEEGGRILGQIGHMGATGSAANMIVWAPSRIVSELTRDVAKEMTEPEILELIDGLEKASGRIREGGLDGVELLMSYGSLLAEFLSPYSNRRQDGWGGSFEARLRLPLAAVEAARRAAGPELIVGVKLVGADYVEGGLTGEDCVEVARRLAGTGLVDYLSVTAGNNLTRVAQKRDRWPTGSPHGEFRHLSRAVKRAVGGLPVCCIGGVTDLELAEEIVASGDADMVGMVRAHIADPDVVRKAEENRLDEVRPCIHANVCINVTQGRRSIRCIGNPEVGEEGEWESPAAATSGAGRLAVVVGAGPGGLEAARALAGRGHRVVVFEKEGSIGGQMLRWSASSRLRESRRLIDWWSRTLESLGVEVRLGAAASAEDVLRLQPALAVVATGAVPAPFPVPARGGASPVRRLDAFEALDGPAGKVAVVLDEMGRSDAAAIAERLAETCASVHLVTSCVHVAEGEGSGTLYSLLARLHELSITIVERMVPNHLEGDRLHLRSPFGAGDRVIEGVDLLTGWAGGVSVDGISGPLREAGVEVQVIGDALVPRRVHDAVYEGASLGRTALATAGA